MATPGLSPIKGSQIEDNDELLDGNSGTNMQNEEVANDMSMMMKMTVVGQFNK